MRIVVVGGSGLIGDKVMTALHDAGHQAVAASPAFGIDAFTGEGLDGTRRRGGDGAARVQATRGDRRRIVADPDARYFGAVVRGDALLPGPEARIATLRLADWLAGRGDKAAVAA
jgi:nucleoside-diphosphate-sugar epimerase